jgi:cytochrome c553
MSEPVENAKRGLIARIGAMGRRISLTKVVIAGAIVGALVWLHYPESAATQPATVNAGSDDLKAVYANAADVAEGKSVADASCSGCHGANGISDTAGIPNLAGQRPAYLYLELRVYQTGGRGDSDMNNAVKFLSDTALFKVSAYYASLDPEEGGAKAAKAVAPEPDPVQAGKTAAASCAGCHGETGISRTPGTPSLAGLDPKYMVAAMSGYNSGQRKHDLMKALLGPIGDADLGNIALYYALQKPDRAQTPVSGDQAAGKAAAAACAGCHGEQGVSTNPSAPSLAGQDAQYLAAAIKAYKDGTRDDATMKGLVASLDAGVVQNLAAFYRAQPPQPLNVRKPLTTVEWAQRCDRCHGVNGNSTDPRSPALAGQRADYLKKVLNDYRTGVRKSPQMAAMSGVLTEEDIDKLAAYYARQNARAFVYVILSPK